MLIAVRFSACHVNKENATIQLHSEHLCDTATIGLLKYHEQLRPCSSKSRDVWPVSSNIEYMQITYQVWNMKRLNSVLFPRLSYWLACLSGGRNALTVPHFSQLLTLLNSTVNLNYIWRSSPYRTANTLRLRYKNQSVNAVERNDGCLFSDPHKTHKYTL